MQGSARRVDVRHGRGFDFVAAMQPLVVDVTQRVPEMGHIDPRYVAFATSQTRKNVSHGLYASLTPLRFAGGHATETRNGRMMRIQAVQLPGDIRALYILTFYLPRCMETSFREKMITLFHELWHISPEFNGDLRRHPGRCYAHTHSQKEYDEQMGVLVDRYLAANPSRSLYSFLEHNFGELHRLHGGVIGRRIARPKIYPVANVT